MSTPRGFELTLTDGTPVLIRPVYAGDRERLRRGIGELSDLSRTMRFFTPAANVSDAQLDYFTQIDQIRHVAWCGVVPDPPQRGYGLARFIRDATDPAVADFAIAVIDEMQGLGLGTILLATLYLRARQLGVGELRGEVLPTNTVIAGWLQQMGAQIAPSGDASYRLLRWPVVDPQDLPHDTPTAQRFARRLEILGPRLAGADGI